LRHLTRLVVFALAAAMLFAAPVAASDGSPAPVLAMFWLRERIVGLLGIAKGRPDTFAVDKIADGEALIEADEKHLRFVASVQADNDAGLLHVVTAVELKNRAGRIYFAPVQVLHGVITRAMMTSARKRLCT